MEENCPVPLPINLNCWKHHAGFIKNQILSVTSVEEIEKLNSSLRKIGELQMDLYLGKFLVEEISNQIIKTLKREKTFSFEDYKKWLYKDRKGYQLVKLMDKSIWTLRLGENEQRYIHIHPGRYSLHTIRVKATTLKTAILALCFEQVGEMKSINTEAVNHIRKKYLNEPPIKSLSKASGLMRLIGLLYKEF
jgi:hypothetical protein